MIRVLIDINLILQLIIFTPLLTIINVKFWTGFQIIFHIPVFIDILFYVSYLLYRYYCNNNKILLINNNILLTVEK